TSRAPAVPHIPPCGLPSWSTEYVRRSAPRHPRSDNTPMRCSRNSVRRHLEVNEMTAPNDAPSLKDSIPPRWRDANVLPLWLSRTAHKPAPPPPLPSHWAWERLRGLIVDVQHEVDTDMVERRVLQLLAADLPDWSREA